MECIVLYFKASAAQLPGTKPELKYLIGNLDFQFMGAYVILECNENICRTQGKEYN